MSSSSLTSRNVTRCLTDEHEARHGDRATVERRRRSRDASTLAGQWVPLLILALIMIAVLRYEINALQQHNKRANLLKRLHSHSGIEVWLPKTDSSAEGSAAVLEPSETARDLDDPIVDNRENSRDEPPFLQPFFVQEPASKVHPNRVEYAASAFAEQQPQPVTAHDDLAAEMAERQRAAKRMRRGKHGYP